MNKRVVSIVCALGLVAGLLAVAVPAHAQDAPAIPEVVQIEDPLNDGNFLNDQGNRDITGFQGDNVTPVDASTVGDLMKVWFSHDAESVSINYQTQAPGPAATSILYQTYSSPGEGTVGKSAIGCLRWVALIPGMYQGQKTTYQGKEVIKLVDRCNDGTNVFNNGVEGTYKIASGPENTGILTVTFPRSYSPLLADGQTILTPYAETRIAVGGETPVATTFNSTATIDNTKPGTDYAFATSTPNPGPVDEPKEEPPGKSDPPGKGKKKGCGKGKGKQKGACPGDKPGKPATPKPPTEQCAPFQPGEAGADKPTLTVTDDATEAKPIEQKVKLDASLANARLVSAVPAAGPLAATQDTFNIQVDPKAAEAGLWVLVEFPARRDFDLNLFHADGSYAARARSWNTVLGTPASLFSAAGHGGEGTDKSEKLLGIRTADCGGWTLAVENHFGEAAEVTVKLWLGEAKTDPQEMGKEKPK